MPIYKVRAPALPLATPAYEQAQQDQFQNVLRLYFNRLDDTLINLSDTNGGAGLTFPYIGASDSTNQYATGNDTPTLVTWDTADEIAGWTLDPSGFASPDFSGVYNIVYSLQIANNDNAIHDAYVWLKVNGEDVPKSMSKFTLAARKSNLLFTYVVAYSSVLFEARVGDEVELWWATDAAATSGGTAGIYIENIPAQVTPYERASAPSAIGSITFVSAIE